jgi:WD40 repeat protein
LHFDGRIAGLTCDPAGRFLAAIQANSSVVHLWEISTGHLVHTLWHAGWVTELTADTHGGWFASTDDHGDVRVWNWPPPNCDAPDALSSAQVEGVDTLAADAELRCLATVDHGGSLRLWDADTGMMRHLPRPAYCKALAVAPNGAWVATIHKDRLEIVDVLSGMVRHTIEGVYASKDLVAIPHRNAVAAHVPSAIRVWNVDSGRPILELPHSSWRTGDLLADPLGRWLAVASHDALRIWSLPSGEQMAVIDGFVGSPVIGAGGRWIVGTLKRGRIEVWDSATGEHLRSLTGGDVRVDGVAVDPNGRWIASRHDDNYVIDLWDVELGSRVRTLGEHPGGVTTFAPSPHGGLLASAGRDGVIKVWRPWAGRLIASLRVSAAVWHLCWADERLIAAGAYGPYVLRLVDRPESRLGQE